MRVLTILLIIAVGMFLFPACGGESDDQTEKTGKGNNVIEEAQKVADDVSEKAKAAMEGMSCAGCAALMKGETGWCAECGTGFYEGKEVNCKGSCQANPGGPPCGDCVKQ